MNGLHEHIYIYIYIYISRRACAHRVGVEKVAVALSSTSMARKCLQLSKVSSPNYPKWTLPDFLDPPFPLTTAACPVVLLKVGRKLRQAVPSPQLLRMMMPHTPPRRAAPAEHRMTVESIIMTGWGRGGRGGEREREFQVIYGTNDDPGCRYGVHHHGDHVYPGALSPRRRRSP